MSLSTHTNKYRGANTGANGGLASPLRFLTCLTQLVTMSVLVHHGRTALSLSVITAHWNWHALLTNSVFTNEMVPSHLPSNVQAKYAPPSYRAPLQSGECRAAVASDLKTT
jgi:hypothetical protein